MSICISPPRLGASLMGGLSAAAHGVICLQLTVGVLSASGYSSKLSARVRTVFTNSVLLAWSDVVVKFTRVIKPNNWSCLTNTFPLFIAVSYYLSFSVELTVTILCFTSGLFFALICVNQRWIFCGSWVFPWLSAPGVCPRNDTVYTGIARIPSE